MTSTKRKALILPGAGARGAYQVGVLKGIAELLPKRAANPFAIIAGVSAGAINAAVLATRAQNFEHAVAEMERVWANFSADQVYKTDAWTMFKSSARWLAAIVSGGLGDGNPTALLDSSPLRALLEKRIPFHRIATALERRHLDCLAVTASAYTSARSVTFYQSAHRHDAWSRVRRIGRPSNIGLDHLMASSSVPFLFPPVRIGGEFYGDGAMRHRAPLSSAIHLGADRMLVIGVRDEHPDKEPGEGAETLPPSLAHLAGYMLDTLFMDGIYADLERLTRINQILEEFGMSQIQSAHGVLRPIHAQLVVPSEDLREVAARHAHELPRAVRLLLRGLGSMNAMGMQFVSYLLFESGFTRELIGMGYRDARACADELRAFLYDEPIGTLDAPVFLKEQIEH